MPVPVSDRAHRDAIFLAKWLEGELRHSKYTDSEVERYVEAIAAMHTQSAVVLLALSLASGGVTLPQLPNSAPPLPTTGVR